MSPPRKDNRTRSKKQYRDREAPGRCSMSPPGENARIKEVRQYRDSRGREEPMSTTKTEEAWLQDFEAMETGWVRFKLEKNVIQDKATGGQ